MTHEKIIIIDFGGQYAHLIASRIRRQQVLAEIHQPDEVLDNMDEWCVRQHGMSGLTERCRKSTVTELQACEMTIDFLKDYVHEKL